MSMFTKAAIVLAFFNAFVLWQVHQIDKDISEKTAQVQQLDNEIQEVQKSVGLAETVEYVEKIGLVDQIKGEINELEQDKTEFESQIKH